MKYIWLVIWEDHHTDTGAYAFASEEGAIAWAREQGALYCNRFGDFAEHELTASMGDDGWVFLAKYGDGDSIRVQRKELRP